MDRIRSLMSDADDEQMPAGVASEGVLLPTLRLGVRRAKGRMPECERGVGFGAEGRRRHPSTVRPGA